MSWLDNEILNNPQYLSWLKQWLFTNVVIEKNKDNEDKYLCTNILSFIPSENEKRRNNNDKSYTNDRTAVFKLYCKLINSKIDSSSLEKNISPEPSETKDKMDTIADMLKMMKFEEIRTEDILRIVKRYMVSERNFMRLYSMQKSYQKLDSISREMSAGKGLTQNKYYVAFRKTMLCILSQSISEPPADIYGSNLPEAFKFIYKMEWLFSYIKVLSREHIVSDYASRQAIVNILRDLSYLASTKKEA